MCTFSANELLRFFFLSIELSLEAFVFLSFSESSTASLSSKTQSIFSSHHALYDLILR